MQQYRGYISNCSDLMIRIMLTITLLVENALLLPATLARHLGFRESQAIYGAIPVGYFSENT